MNGYCLTENWFNFVSENSDKVECKHTALYLYIVEMFNKRGWVDVIGLPTDFTMGVLNIKSYKNYISILHDLIDFGYIKMIEKSKNQYTSNKIALVENTKANPKHIPKQVESNDQSDDQSKLSIIKLLNLETIKLLNDNASIIDEHLKVWIKEYKQSLKTKNIDFNLILETWNRFAFKFNKPQIKELSKSRKNKIRTRSAENDFDVYKILVEATKQDFLLDKSWFTFDWMIENDKNYVKVLEGNYKTKETTNDAPKFKI